MKPEHQELVQELVRKRGRAQAGALLGNWLPIRGFPGYETDKETLRVRSWKTPGGTRNTPYILKPILGSSGVCYGLYSGEPGRVTQKRYYPSQERKE